MFVHLKPKAIFLEQRKESWVQGSMEFVDSPGELPLGKYTCALIGTGEMGLNRNLCENLKILFIYILKSSDH